MPQSSFTHQDLADSMARAEKTLAFHLSETLLSGGKPSNAIIDLTALLAIASIALKGEGVTKEKLAEATKDAVESLINLMFDVPFPAETFAGKVQIIFQEQPPEH